MKLNNRRSLVGLLVAGCLLTVANTRALGSEVRDQAGLFSPAAIKQADETIRVMQRDFRKELLVESFPGVPDNRKADYERNREQFFANFLRERAQAARVDGIYVLLMKELPPHSVRIQVGVGEATRQRAFLASDRDALVRVLQASFREKKYDDGLREAAAFVERTMRHNLAGSPAVGAVRPATAVAQKSSEWSWLPWLLLIVGGIIVVSFVMRLLRGSAGSAGGSVPPVLGSSGGGGFLSSLLGGIGGAMAGSYLYDRFFSDHSQAGDRWNSSAGEAPRSDAGGDYSSSGGDADSGSGGSDFGGGGDSGGGDSGGSDF